MKSVDSNSKSPCHPRDGDVAPPRFFPLSIAVLFAVSLMLLNSGCDQSSGTGYSEVLPGGVNSRKSPTEKPSPEIGTRESNPQPDAKPSPPMTKGSQTPDMPPAAQQTSQNMPPKAAPGETATDPLRMRATATPNPLAGGDDGPVRLLVPDKTFQKKGDALVVSYDDLDLIKVLNLKVPTPNVMELLPQWLKNLDGAKVRIRGFMYPAFQEEGLDRFVFCRDTGACCFGPNPVIYYLIDVRMLQGKTTNYIQNRPFDVTGTLRIKPGIIPETGLVYELYHLEDAVVSER